MLLALLALLTWGTYQNLFLLATWNRYLALSNMTSFFIYCKILVLSDIIQGCNTYSLWEYHLSPLPFSTPSSRVIPFFLSSQWNSCLKECYRSPKQNTLDWSNCCHLWINFYTIISSFFDGVFEYTFWSAEPWI